MADEKTINRANEQINKELYGVADELIKRDNLKRLKEKSRQLSNKNTGGKDQNGMMNTILEIASRNQIRKGSNVRVNKRDERDEMKKLISTSIGLGGDFSDVDTKRINRYNDYRVIDEYIPELAMSVDVLRDSILSPDDFSKKDAFFRYDDGGASKEDRTIFEEKIKELSKKFDIEQYIKDSAREALLLGDDFTIVRPIREEFTHLLTEDTTDGVKYLLEDEGSYITDDIYNDELMRNLSEFLEEATHGQFRKPSKEEQSLDPTGVLNDVVKSVRDNLLVVKNAEKLLTDRKRVYKDLGKVRGAYFKHVRPDDIIKLELDHVCIGYLYFDRSIDQDSANILGRTNGNTTLLQSMTSALNSDSDSSGAQNSYNQTTTGGATFNHTDTGRLSVEGNTAKAYDALVRLFSRGISEKINKRFLEDNAEFREVILSLLKNDYLITKKVAITFLEPEDVLHNKLNSSETYGKSIYKNGLFFAKLYLINTLNTMMIKINQGRDKRVYYVENGLDDDFEGNVEALVRDLKSKEIPTSALDNGNSITTVMRQVGSLESYIIPVNDGSRSFDIDVIPGMQTDVDESDMDRLLRSAQRATGVPYNYIDASTDIDFARTLAIQNQGFVKNIITYQSTFSAYYTKVVQRLWKYEFGEDLAPSKPEDSKKQAPKEKTEKVQPTSSLHSDYVMVSFPAPITLNASTISEQISATDQLIDYLTTLNYGDEDETNRQQRQLFKKNLSRDVYLKNIDWNLIDEVKNKTDEEVNKAELDKPKSDSESDEGTSFNY